MEPEMMNNHFTVVIDTREQLPYQFPNSIVKTLSAGDYSIEGLELIITIERKTLADAYQTIGRGRKRFIKELEKLAKYQYAAIVIESSLREFLQPPPFSQLNPKSVINSLLAWNIRYGVHIFFTCDRLHGAAITYRILEKFYKHYQKSAVIPPASAVG